MSAPVLFTIFVLNDVDWGAFLAGRCEGAEVAAEQMKIFQQAYPDREFKVLSDEDFRPGKKRSTG